MSNPNYIIGWQPKGDWAVLERSTDFSTAEVPVYVFLTRHATKESALGFIAHMEQATAKVRERTKQ